MSVDAAAVATQPEVAPRPIARVRAVPLVALALGLAFGVRLVLVWTRATPNYFPDEYLYAALGRSLSSLDAPTIRGAGTHFPALLQPLLTAPAWRIGNVETGYRIVQALSALAVTLAAVPTYALARRLGTGRGIAGALALFALVLPDTVYASFVIAEPFAYPLVVAGVFAGVVALAQPTRRAQLAFLALAALATFARIQFVVLPLAWLLAMIVLGARERRLRAVVKEQRLVLAACLALGVAVIASGPGKLLGYYSSVLHPHVHAIAVFKSLALNGLVLVYAGGWILIPGALLGLALAVGRPRSRLELAFGSLTVCLGIGLLAQAALFGDATIAQERYVFYVLPLLAIAFVSYAQRGWPHVRAHALLAIGLLLASLRFPLSDYSATDTMKHSPVLLGFYWLESRISAADAAMSVAVAATVLTGVVLVASLRPRIAKPLVLALALGSSLLALAAATTFDTTNSRNVVGRFLPSNREWVDAAHVGRATLLVTPGQSKTDAEAQLFWNRSIDRLAVMPYTAPPDRMHTDAVQVTSDGTLLVDNEPLRGPLVVGTAFATTVFRQAAFVAHAPYFKLVSPRGRAQLALQMLGRGADGHLGDRGVLFVWPESTGKPVSGWLELSLHPTESDAASVRITREGVFHRTVSVAGRAPTQLRVRACASGPWIAGFSVRSTGAPPSASVPRFVPDPQACNGVRPSPPTDSAQA